MDDKKQNSEQEKKQKQYNLYDIRDVIHLIKNCEGFSSIEKPILDHINEIVSKYEMDYNVILLYQPYESITELLLDSMYNAVSKNANKKLLLILNSPGGRVEPAYLISKTCKELSSNFIVSIPRKAKSAATLIALGANEIHMGIMSELGPIDPQFSGLPALALSSALDKLAQLSTKYPLSSEMFANYLAKKLDLDILGYFERVSESAVQYAQRLLKGKHFPNKHTEESIAQSLVYSYKDHSFVIDRDEIKQYLGEHIKVDTQEYILGNEIHAFLEMANLFSDIFKKTNFGIVGTDFKYVYKQS